MLKNEKWLLQLFNNKGVGILIVDKNRNILEVNDCLCQMSGYSHKELVNNSAECFHVSKESYLDFKLIAFNEVLDHHSINLEYMFKHKNGKNIWVKIAGEEIDDTEDILWIVNNITEEIGKQKEINKLNAILNSRIEEQVEILRQKDRQLQYHSRLSQMGEMLNMIAHQWRQPLSAITSTISYLYGKTMIGEFNKTEFLNELSHIEDYSSHLSSTIDDFRNFFKPNKKLEMTTIEEVINSTLKIIEPILLNKNIKINTSYKCNKYIYSLKNEIRQVILNILKNSEDAFLERNIEIRLIQINTYEMDNYAVIEIIDNAGGIKEEFLNKIFDSYFSTKSIEKGTGLGLCMSKTIIENNCKGKIKAKNSKNGTTFTIAIPLKIDN
jgi:PAS domain S-box-containing protein